MKSITVSPSDNIQHSLSKLESSGGLLRLEPGDYFPDSLIYESDKPLTIMGCGPGVTNLIPLKDGFNIKTNSSDTKKPVSISDMSVLSSTKGKNKGFSFNGQYGSDLGKQLNLSNVSFEGTNNKNCWRHSLDVSKGGFSQINNCWFRGSTGEINEMKSSIRFEDSTNVMILNNYFYWQEVGITVRGQSEGFVIKHQHIVPCIVGIDVETVNPGEYFDISGNHASARLMGIDVKGASHSQINHNLLFKNGASDSNYLGMKIDSSFNSIMGNSVIKQGPSSENGILVKGKYSRLIGNHFSEQDTGIIFAPDSSDNIAYHNTFDRSGAIWDRGTGNRWEI